MPSIQTEIRLGEQKRLNFKSDFLHLGRLYKSGSFDMKIKADYVNAKELKAQLLNGTMFKSILSTNSRGKLAVGEGDKVSIFDIEQVIGKPSTAPVTVDKTSIKVLSKSHVRFELVHIVFNAANENYVAVAGYEDCQIFTINGRGEVIDRLAVDLALQGAHIRRVIWIPQSQVQIMVVTNKFVKVYDLSQDNISPLHYFTILEDDIVDATLVSLGQERLILIVLSQQGVIYTHRINSGASQGACILTDTLILPETFKSERGLSLHYSSVLRVLFLSYSNGLSLIAHLDADGTSLTDISSIIEVDQDMKSNAAELHSWR
jgi:E3 ubiquitin-protein ligase UBR4